MACNIFKLAPAVMLAGAAAFLTPTMVSAQITLFSEDFESLTPKLQKPVFEANAGGGIWTNVNVFTHTPPFGWTVDASGVPDSGDPEAEEWRGWSFARKDFWVSVAGDQTRAQFTLGQGIVAIADPDEYDDSPVGIPGNDYYDTFMRTPAISLANVSSNQVTLTFDSSWRPEGFDDGDPPQDNNQTAVIRASFNGGTSFIEVLRWDSDVLGNFFHPDSQNETVNVTIPIPAGSTSLILDFGMELARNDWWWAVDNIRVTTGVATARSVSGTVSLEGKPITAPFEGFFTVHAIDNSIPDLVVAASVNAQGQFTLRNLPPKSYRIKFKTPQNLSRVFPANVTAGDVSGIVVPILKTGDATNDDAADIADLQVLIAAYNKISPAAGYQQTADFNGDGTNDIADLQFLITNYNQIGESF